MRIRNHSRTPWVARYEGGEYVVEEGDREAADRMIAMYEQRFGLRGEALFRKLSSMLTRAFYIDEGDGAWVHLGSGHKRDL